MASRFYPFYIDSKNAERCSRNDGLCISKSVYLFLFFIFSSGIILQAQETNSKASGRVFLDQGESADGVAVTLIHEPTQNNYASLTNQEGYFHFFNLKPGGPYSIIFNSIGYKPLKVENLSVHLTGEHFLYGKTEMIDFTLQKKITSLTEVVINTSRVDKNKSGLETNISRSTLSAMPSISRNFQDYIRLIPQAKVNGEGLMSLAGQNNRFNAFFIDGANNTDIRGGSVSGMNGGQTGSPPMSMEAIEEIIVLLAPYNVQYGNFTGGSINAITRSGSNENKSSAWYYFRNENMAGRSPQDLDKPGFPGEYYRPRLSSFFNQTFGAWNSGALVKNKLFYFALAERQSEARPQPFNINDYRGNSNKQQLFELTDFLKNTYQYDPGSFLETKDVLDATRVNFKLDWNASLKNKFMLSYWYNNAERLTSPRPSSATAISFQNNGVILSARTHSGSFEWKRFFNANMNNRLLISFTNQVDDRKWIGQPFPSLFITDGDSNNGSTISLGSENSTGITAFKATVFNLFDVFNYVKKMHVITFGIDMNHSFIDTRVIPNYFGFYRYKSLSDLINKAAPTRLQRTFYRSEDKLEKFNTLRTGIFLNNEIRLRSNLKFNFGLRLDINSILSKPETDRFFNDSAIHTISRYYDLDGAKTGIPMSAHWGFSPRFNIDYKLLKHGIHLTGGAGIFLGHIVNPWIFDVFNGNTGNIDLRPPPQFNPDPYSQPTTPSLSSLTLMSKHFKFPTVFKTSFTLEKKLQNNWTFSIEGIFTKNIHEAAFRNVNIIPPIGKSSMPDSRNIYSVSDVPSNIPLKANGTNPYQNIYLLTNNFDKKGSSFSLSFIVSKQSNHLTFNSSYTYGRSNVLFEITGPQTPVASQWRNMETVNGRNFTALSTSDNDLRHRITTWISNRINFPKYKTTTTISLFYNGQSGSPFSYVYAKSMINDNGKVGENFDLFYIPTTQNLVSMNFVSIKDNKGQILYTPEIQKNALTTFIENDNYLKNHRGEFAQRNAARLPFTHIIDLRLQQDVTIKLNKKKMSLTITYDVFNLTNMLNRNWGRIWFLSNDSYPIVTFDSFLNSTDFTQPQYQFIPIKGKPWTLQTSTLPGSSARWISQLGMKINF